MIGENTFSIENLQKLLNSFYQVCSFCNDLNIYEYPEIDDDMQEMKSWCNKKFARKISPESKITKEDIKKLLNSFYRVCSFCDELNIYEYPPFDESMQEMKSFCKKTFGYEIS